RPTLCPKMGGSSISRAHRLLIFTASCSTSARQLGEAAVSGAVRLRRSRRGHRGVPPFARYLRENSRGMCLVFAPPMLRRIFLLLAAVSASGCFAFSTGPGFVFSHNNPKAYPNGVAIDSIGEAAM